jgi:hypothetical protein
VVFKYGMKRDFSKWLASLGPAAPVKTLGELRNWNLARRNAGTLKFSQSQLDNSDEMDVEADRARYLADRAKDIELSGPSGIDAVCEPSGSTRCSSRWTPARSCPRRRGIRRSSCHSRWSRTPDATVPAGIRDAADAVRGELRRRGVQRAAPDRACLRPRAGDQAMRAAAALSMIAVDWGEK